MIRVKIEPEAGRILITGHAEKEKAGREIVCAAVSMASDVLRCGCAMLGGNQADDGETVRAEGRGEKWRAVLTACSASLKRLAEAHPEHVEVMILGGHAD